MRDHMTSSPPVRRILVFFCLIVSVTVLAMAAWTETKADSAYGYILPEASWRNYSYEEIAGMPVQVICYAKNEIYARNGRMFVSSELQNYFNQQYWYSPVYQPQQFMPEMLNTFETANVELLARRESELGGYQLDTPFYSYLPVYQYISGSYSAYYSNGYNVNPDSYIFYDSDKRYLTDAEIAQLSLQEVCYAKNEVYARRGRMFVSSELQNYFSQKNWYWGFIPPEQFSDSVFNAFEVTNVSSLQAREYALSPNGYILDQPGYTYSNIGSYTSHTVYGSTGSDFIFWDSNTRYLTDAEVAGLSLQQLCYARNEIYARRGYIFQSQELRDYFGSKSWYYGYIPGVSFSSSVFNSYEMTNIELLKRYEYAINPNGYQLY